MTRIPHPSWESQTMTLNVSALTNSTSFNFTHNLEKEIIYSRLLITALDGINEGYTFEGTPHAPPFKESSIQGLFTYTHNELTAAIHTVEDSSGREAFLCMGRYFKSHFIILFPQYFLGMSILSKTMCISVSQCIRRTANNIF